MALEIERRFLVHGDGWRPQVRWSRSLRQGYLTRDAAGVTVRVRLGEDTATDQARLTIKAAAAGIARHEFEYPIPATDGEALLKLAAHGLGKTRYGLDLPGGDWVVDVFEPPNAPLVLAEVELERADQPLEVPPWCALEVTGRLELSNASLSITPLSQWPEEERQAVLAAMGLRAQATGPADCSS